MALIGWLAVSTGKVDFQLVRNFVGGFIQMRRLLCNPKAWRELMKMNLEKLPAKNGNGFWSGKGKGHGFVWFW